MFQAAWNISIRCRRPIWTSGLNSWLKELISDPQVSTRADFKKADIIQLDSRLILNIHYYSITCRFWKIARELARIIECIFSFPSTGTYILRKSYKRLAVCGHVVQYHEFHFRSRPMNAIDSFSAQVWSRKSGIPYGLLISGSRFEV